MKSFISVLRPPARRADVSTNPQLRADKESFYDIVDKDMDGNEGATKR